MGWRRGLLINVEVHVSSANRRLITLYLRGPRSAGEGVKEKKQPQRSLALMQPLYWHLALHLPQIHPNRLSSFSFFVPPFIRSTGILGGSGPLFFLGHRRVMSKQPRGYRESLSPPSPPPPPLPLSNPHQIFAALCFPTAHNFTIDYLLGKY